VKKRFCERMFNVTKFLFVDRIFRILLKNIGQSCAESMVECCDADLNLRRGEAEGLLVTGDF